MVNILGFFDHSYAQDEIVKKSFRNITYSNISNNTGDSVYGQIAGNNDAIYVVWQDNLNEKNRFNYDIFFKKSIDGGKTYDETINLSNNIGFSEHPQIAISENNVYVVWADNTFGKREIYFTKSKDGGITFNGAINLSKEIIDSHNQEIAAYGNNVYVIWQGTNISNSETRKILLRSSNDGGASFGNAIELTNNAVEMSFPKVAAYDDNVYAAWNVEDTNINNLANNEGIFFTKSMNNGNRFEQAVKLNDKNTSGELQLSVDKDNVYLAWGGSLHKAERSTNENSVMFTKSIDNGNNFSSPIRLHHSFQHPSNIELAQHEGNVYIAVQGLVPNSSNSLKNEEIFLITSIDNGDTFSKAINISNNSGVSECPSIAIYNNKIYLTWEDITPGNHEVLSAVIA